MPSSLIFAALAVAWLVVLVPMFARRRQEVAHPTESALAARVVRRGSDRKTAGLGVARQSKVEENEMTDTVPADTDSTEIDSTEIDRADLDEYDETEWRAVHSDDVRAGRRYRPGRGGFDPEAAALAASAKYARRQRIVLGMLLTAVVTVVGALFVTPLIWWAHAATDLSLVGYLTYLRRQVKIEEDVRRRRLARLSGAQEAEPDSYDDFDDGSGDVEAYDEVEPDEGFDEDVDEQFDEDLEERFGDDLDAELDERSYTGERPEDGRSASSRRPARPASATNAVVVEIDDEDPMFDELDERTWEPYRRAAGE